MKKILILALAVVMVCAVAACGNGGNSEEAAEASSPAGAGLTEQTDEWIKEQLIGTWKTASNDVLTEVYDENGTIETYANDIIVEKNKKTYYVQDSKVYVDIVSEDGEKHAYSFKMSEDGKKMYIGDELICEKVK